MHRIRKYKFLESVRQPEICIGNMHILQCKNKLQWHPCVQLSGKRNARKEKWHTA